MTGDLGPAARAGAARVWAVRRGAELEASARFEALAARLSACGASAPVISMAREAARDELRHAELCARLVEHFGGASLPEARPPSKLSRVAPADLDERDAVLYEVVALSCVTETLSAAMLGALVGAARDSLARETMHSILRDEVRHSRVGWAFLAEAHAAGARDVIAPHLAAMIAVTLGTALFQSAPVDPLDAHLAGFGQLDRPTRRRLARECFETVIFPGLEHFGIVTVQGRQWLKQAESTS